MHLSMTAPVDRPAAVTADELCTRYLSAVHRFAAFACRDDVLAEDVAQDAMIKAISKVSSYDQARGDLDGWLWRIVARTVIDHARRGQRLQAVVERVAASLESLPPVNAEDSAVARASDAQLRAALRTLPPAARAVLGLRFGAGLTYDEIAATLGMSSAAVRMRAGRALRRLRLELGARVDS